MINTPRRLPRVPTRAEAASEISMNIVGVARAIRIDRRNNGERRARADYVFARGTRGMPTRGFEFFRRAAEVYRQSSYGGPRDVDIEHVEERDLVSYGLWPANNRFHADRRKLIRLILWVDPEHRAMISGDRIKSKRKWYRGLIR